jgi:predicted DNA-binding protein with PD1-like motif
MLVLERGESVRDVLTTAATDHEWGSAVIISGLGAVTNITCGDYDVPTKSYRMQTYDTPHEVVSLTGNLTTKEGQPFWHLHGVFSNEHNETRAGHLEAATVAITLELAILITPATLMREYDATTGLFLIAPSS